MARRLFTSESVTEGHPDKIADQISDGILDALLSQDPRSRVAVETLITTGQVHVAGEVTTKAYADIPSIVRETILGIGYDSSKKGFDGASCGVSVSIGSQSPDIAAELGAAKRPGQLLVAFAAETHDALENARGKLVRKRADLIVVNEVGVDLVFGSDNNTVTILGADGSTTELGELPKDDVADAIWDQVAGRLDPQVGALGTG